MVILGTKEFCSYNLRQKGELGRFWRFGRAWLCQPSEFYDEINFLGINYCSTYKKVSKDPHFISIYFREYEIHYYQAVVTLALYGRMALIF